MTYFVSGVRKNLNPVGVVVAECIYEPYVFNHSVAPSSAECNCCSQQLSTAGVLQLLTICDIVWHLRQGHMLVAAKPHFFWHDAQWPWLVYWLTQSIYHCNFPITFSSCFLLPTLLAGMVLHGSWPQLTSDLNSRSRVSKYCNNRSRSVCFLAILSQAGSPWMFPTAASMEAQTHKQYT